MQKVVLIMMALNSKLQGACLPSSHDAYWCHLVTNAHFCPHVVRKIMTENMIHPVLMLTGPLKAILMVDTGQHWCSGQKKAEMHCVF